MQLAAGFRASGKKTGLKGRKEEKAFLAKDRLKPRRPSDYKTELPLEQKFGQSKGAKIHVASFRTNRKKGLL